MEIRRVELERLPSAALVVPVAVTVLAALAYAGFFLEKQHPILSFLALLIVVSAIATGVVIAVARRRLAEDASRIADQTLLLHSKSSELESQRLELASSMEEIRASEARARLLLASVQEGVMLLDEHQQIIALNDSALRLFGMQAEEATSLPSVLSHGKVTREDGTVVRLDHLPSQRAMSSGLAQPAETLRYVRNSGEVIWLTVTARPIESTDGMHGIVAVSLKDITTIKKAEVALMHAKEQLLQSQKMEAIGRLAGGVAHDFNNLLTVIVTYSELLKTSLAPGTPQRNDIDEIENAARRATALTRQLLAFSRGQVLTPEDLDMSDVVRGMIGMLSRLLGEDVELVTKEAEFLSCANADRGQLEQVIANLAINARDAMPRGGVLIIETSEIGFEYDYADHDGNVIPAGRYVQLCVSDTGDGMDEATRARIFDPFFTTKPPGKGTGLGLSTVIGIVSQSGGYMSVYSSPGRGTTFKIYLPALDRKADYRPRAVKTHPPLETAHTGKLLLVEDDESVRRATARLLQKMGFDVHAVDDPVTALNKLENGEYFDLMLTDMVMPHMNGDQLAREVLALYPSIRVVIMSGYSEEASNRHWALPPNTIFVEKPISRETLSAKLREAMSRTV